MTFIIRAISSHFQPNGPTCGLVFTEASGGPRVSAVRLHAGNTLDVTNFNSPTSYNGGVTTTTTDTNTPFRWFKLSDDGTTNRTVHVSVDGNNWILFSTESRTSLVTADCVGFYCEAPTSGFPGGIKLVSAKLN